MPQVTIPEALKPVDGRFGSGPSKVRPEALAGLAATGNTFLGTSHRANPVKRVVGRIRAGLGELFSLPEGYEVVLGNGGATSFWDAAACGLVRRRSQHLVFGEFSSKFAAATTSAPWLEDPSIRKASPGELPAVAVTPGVDLYALTHNETSTGVAMTISRPAGTDGTLVAVDATSAAAGLPVDIAAADAYYFSPQKGLGSDGGLWLAVLSPAALERVAQLHADPKRWIPTSLSLQTAVTNSRADQTYNTPPLATLWLVADQLDWMLARGGLAWTTARTAESSSVLYDWAEKTGYTSPFVADPAHRSAVVGTVEFDDAVDAVLVRNVLRDNGIVDLEPYRSIAANGVRVGMFPAVDPADVQALTACIDYVVTALS